MSNATGGPIDYPGREGVRAGDPRPILDPADASAEDELAEQTDNSGEPGDRAPQGASDVQLGNAELDDGEADVEDDDEGGRAQ